MEVEEKVMRRDEVRAKLMELDKKRRAIEEEMSECQALINKYPEVFDAEGFPRADVPHEAVAQAKHRAACLKTDYKAVNAEIESWLPYAF